MGRLERTFQLDKILKQSRYPVSLDHLCRLFECSESTAKRTIADMSLYFDAPIINTPGCGYSYAKGSTFELPGVWFSEQELHALLTIQKLTTTLSGGFFDRDIKAIQHKVEKLLGNTLPSADVVQRIRILNTGSRSRQLPMFSTVASALLHRNRLHITYRGRQRDEQTEREISPQRMVYYRSNWYLDAWCHRADDLRSFAVERVEQARIINTACKHITNSYLNKKLTRSFGIFSGEPVATAVLHFRQEAARWAADEQWFPDESGCYLDDGTFELKIPYNNPTELIMEICRYGDGVEVIEPPELRIQVAEALQAAADRYR